MYDQFLSNIDIVTDADPNQPVSTKVKLAYGMMKKIASKDQIIDAAKSAINGIVNDRKAVFEPKQGLKIKEGITDKNLSIQKKLDEIKIMEDNIKLRNSEIEQLQIDIENSNSNIGIRLGCYDTLSTQLLEKVKDDLTGITNYITN